ncbi:MAG TPA: protein kinase, partial [Blastocatellia bacterium]|nr:protein kinase [Blastocatellia bacterium]
VPPDTGPNSVKGEAETLIRRSTDTSPADTLLEQSTRINRSENDTLIKAADGLVAEEAGTLIQHTDQLPVSEESEYRTLLRPSSTGTVGRLRHTTSVPQSATDRSLGATATAKARFSDAHGGARDSGTDLRVGIATDDAGGLTRVGAVMGTPLYMSPEQCRGEALDSRSDVYSLGVIAYRMLCGDTPFSGTLDELLESHASVEPVSPRARNRKVPRKVARVVMSALSKDPQDRPASAAGFASALRAAGEGTGKLLRQSVSLYSEHFPAFLRLSLLAYAPLVLILAANKLLDWLLPMEKAPYIEQVLVGIGGAIFAPMVGHLLAYCIISGVTVPIVIQTNVAPLRPLLIRTGFARLRERWKPFLAASLIVVTVVFFASLLIIPGIIAAVCFGLYAPVVIMEGLGVRATLMRSFQLSRRSWFTVLVTTALQFGLPILVLVHFNDVSLKVSRSQVGFNINISDNLASEASQLLNVFISPLTAVMIALLYLKTRHAGGETLKDAERALDSEYQPRSRWEERMRSRSLTGGSAGSSPR